MTKLTPEAFDALVDDEQNWKVIWTLEAIGRRIGCGKDFVRDVLFEMPGSPIRKMGRRYYVIDRDLHEFWGAYRASLH